MERWFNLHWAVVLYSLLVAAAVFCPAGSDAAEPAASRSDDRFLVLVSLVDGKFAALNVRKDGSVEWTVNAGSRPLVSASIINLQVNTNGGGKARLVPSLDGGLYQMDEEGIEPFPLNADTLLSSSLRFGENSNLVGGKTTERYGIDVNTGLLHYICSVDGCRTFDRGTQRQNGLLIVQRHTKTVRAIELQAGVEKWNFSVAEHSVSYIISTNSVSPDTCQRDTVVTPTDDDDDEELCDSDDPDPLTYSYRLQDDDDPMAAFRRSSEGDDGDLDDLELKVIVPEGVVFAVRANDPTTPVWKHVFGVPIAGAWTLNGDTLRTVNLFDKDIVPALSCGPEDDTDDMTSGAPLLYIGQYLNQLYVQPAVILSSDMNRAMYSRLTGGSHLAVKMPRVHWMPYLATASSRTPAVTRHRNPLRLMWQPDRQRGVTDGQPDDDTDMPHSVVVWTEQYPYDCGFYLYPDYSPLLLNTSKDTEKTLVKPVTLRTWWKEVTALSLVLAVILHVFIEKLRKLYRRNQPRPVESKTSSLESEASTESKLTESGEKKIEKEFQSRFFTDFDPLACLGKGGFGVVFESRNKMDDCLYAIKRISLNNSERGKQKVMREVKALAKLEHTGIVRYYQSWFESPPPGWQEQHDRHYHDMFSTMGCTSEQNSPSARERRLLNPSGDSSSIAVHALSDTGFSASLGVSTGSQCELQTTDDSLLGESRDTNSNVGSSLPGRNVADVMDSFDIVFQDSEKLASQGDSDCRKRCKTDELSTTDRDRGSRCANRTGTGPSGDASTSLSRRKSDTRHVNMASDKERSACMPRLLLYIQMQLCQRESLRDWLRSNTLNRDRKHVLDIFDQILSAVDYVHECGLMHRDLKPSNIFFSLDGTVKVGDFGLVTANEEHVMEENNDIIWGDQDSGTPHRHTNQVGTKLYMSPEQIAGDNYTCKVDIYALGMIFFELFYPFATEMERVKTLLDVKHLQFPARFKRELPNERSFLEPLISHDPSERPDTKDIRCHVMLADFEEARVAVKRLRSLSTPRIHTNSSSSGTSLDRDQS